MKLGRLIFSIIVVLLLALPGSMTIAKVTTGGEELRSRTERRQLTTFTRHIFQYWASGASESLFVNNTRTALSPGIFDNVARKFRPDIIVFAFEESKFAPIKAKNSPYLFYKKLLPPPDAPSVSGNTPSEQSDMQG